MIWTEFVDEMRDLMTILQISIPDDREAKTIDGYYRHLGSWKRDDFKQTCDSVVASTRRTGVLPSVEAFREALRAIKAASGESYTPAIPHDKYATDSEQIGMMRCIKAILCCHKHRIEVNGERLGPIRKSCPPMDLDEWMRSDMPQTWSPLLDTLYESSYKIYRHCMAHGGNEYGRFLNEYADILEKSVHEAESAGIEKRRLAFSKAIENNGHTCAR